MATSDNISGARGLILLLKTVGLWQLETTWNHLGFLRSRFLYIFHFPLSLTYAVLIWIEVFVANDLDQVSDVIYLSLTETSMAAKLLNIWIHGTKAVHFIDEVAHGMQYKLRTEEERKMWSREHRFFKIISIGYIGGSVCVMVPAILGVFFLPTYEMPFPYYIPFEWQHNIRNYWIAFAYGNGVLLITCFVNTGLDMMYCYFLFHVALLYKLLGMRLMALKQGKDEVVLKELRQIFKLHNDIKRLSKTCEQLLTAPVMIQILLSVLILCFSGYRLQNSSITEEPGKYFATLQFLGVITLQIFLPCYYGNEVIINSDYLTFCIYSSNWMQFSAKVRKMIFIYMEYLKKPVHIRAGGFFQIGLPIFLKCMNNAYSLFAVLLNMDKEK